MFLNPKIKGEENPTEVILEERDIETEGGVEMCSLTSEIIDLVSWIQHLALRMQAKFAMA